MFSKHKITIPDVGAYFSKLMDDIHDHLGIGINTSGSSHATPPQASASTLSYVSLHKTVKLIKGGQRAGKTATAARLLAVAKAQQQQNTAAQMGQAMAQSVQNHAAKIWNASQQAQQQSQTAPPPQPAPMNLPSGYTYLTTGYANTMYTHTQPTSQMGASTPLLQGLSYDMYNHCYEGLAGNVISKGDIVYTDGSGKIFSGSNSAVLISQCVGTANNNVDIGDIVTISAFGANQINTGSFANVPPLGRFANFPGSRAPFTTFDGYDDIATEPEIDPVLQWMQEKTAKYLDEDDHLCIIGKFEVLDEIILKRASLDQLSDEDYEKYGKYVKLVKLAEGTESEGEKHNAYKLAKKFGEIIAGIEEYTPEDGQDSSASDSKICRGAERV